MTDNARTLYVNVSYIHMEPSMTSAAQDDAYGNPAWGHPAYGNPAGGPSPCRVAASLSHRERGRFFPLTGKVDARSAAG